MRIRTRSDRLAEFVRVLRGFGLTDDEITALNGAPEADGEPEAVLDRTLPEDLASQELFERVRRTLVESRHGFELAPTHEPRSAFVALSLALEPYGCTFAVTDKDGRPITAPASEDGTYRLSLVDSAGNERTTTFAYPEGPLDDTNVPALVHAVETDLLVGVSKTFVLLSNTGDGWGFALLDETQLQNLRSQYGPRIEVFDHKLLAPTQPHAYGDGTWQAEADGMAFDSHAPASDDDTIPLELEVSPEDADTGTTATSESRTVRDRIEEFDRDDSVETIVAEITTEDGPDRPDPLFVGDPVDSVFEDFSDVRLEPMEPAAEGTGPESDDRKPPAIDGAAAGGEAPAQSGRVLVGAGEGGSGPAVVGAGSPGDADVDDALETRFEQFSDGLPAVVPEAEGTESFRWRAVQEDVASQSASSGGTEDVAAAGTADAASDSEFRFDQDLDDPKLAIHSLDSAATETGNGVADRSEDRGTADDRDRSSRFDRLGGWLSRLLGR